MLVLLPDGPLLDKCCDVDSPIRWYGKDWIAEDGATSDGIPSYDSYFTD